MRDNKVSRTNNNSKPKNPSRIFATNRRATYDFNIIESFEAGVVLHGTEIKSIRDGNVNLREAFARSIKSEIWLYGMHIAPYRHGNVSNHDPIRPRKLLLHRGQIEELKSQGKRKGLTIVPLRLYIRGRFVKVVVALAKGKRRYDKRQALIKAEVERDIQRELHSR